MTDNHIETALRTAMERRAAKVPSLPDDFAQQVMNKMNARKENANQHRVSIPLHYGRGWGWVLSIVAVLLIAFLLWPEKQETPITQPEAQPITAEVNPQPVPKPIVEEKKDETVMAEVQAKAQPVKKRARIDNEQDIQSISSCNHQEVTDIAPPSSNNDMLSSEKQEVLTLPADKQALADIFLAEEALQVAYEQRAQQEALRTYAASITGEEAPGPIIAF